MLSNYFESSKQSPELRVLNMISATWVSRLVQLAVNKNILVEINANIYNCKELSNILDIKEILLFRILRGMEHLGLVWRSEDKYNLTNLGRLLLPDNDAGFYSMATLWGEEFYNSWGLLAETTKSGKSGFNLFYGQDLFHYLQQNPSRGQVFGLAMHSLAKLIYPEVAKLIHLSPNQSIADIGGGTGYLISSILEENPQTTGILFDLPHVILQTSDFKSLGTRLQVIQGDFFDNVPSADSYILSNILHDWNDEKAILILKNIRIQHKLGGKLYIVEMALDHNSEPTLAVSTDLNMLMLTGGKERSLKEFKHLLTNSGYEFRCISNVLNMTCLIEAKAC